MPAKSQSKKVKASESAKRNKLKKEKPYVYQKYMKFKEKIAKGESIAMIQFQYDYTCNMRCEHCCIQKFQKSKKRRAFTIKDVRELSKQADEMGLAQFVISGGEPMLFPDFDELVEAINPTKFYIVSDSNGWLLDAKRAKHLKKIGVDKVQLSLDSLNAKEHDEFRRMPGAHARVLRALDAAKEAGLNTILQTVVWKDRVRSQELIDFFEFAKKKGVGTVITYAKPVGAWEGKFDLLVDQSDLDYIKGLEKKYNIFSHLTPSYGIDVGCIAVKRMISITKYGDVMPCPFIHVALGNFFEEPLKDIVKRGLSIKWFGKRHDTCLAAVDPEFLSEVEAKKIEGRPTPVSYKKVFTKKDYI